MSSILKRTDSATIGINGPLFDFDNSYQVGDSVPDDVAEKVIEITQDTFRKGDLVLAKDGVANGYIYGIFENEVDELVNLNIGKEPLLSINKSDVFRIKDQRSFEDKKDIQDEDTPLPNKKRKIKWSERKYVRIVRNNDKNSRTIIQDTQLKASDSTYKYLLQQKAFSKDSTKFLKIAIISEIAKTYRFTSEIALAALKIKVLRDDDLIEEFDKAIQKLEVLETEFNGETNLQVRDLNLNQCEEANTVLRLFLNEIIKRGLEERIT